MVQKEGTTQYRVAKTDEEKTIASITTDTTGRFTIEGLDSGTYYLIETEAPDGYNGLTNPIKVEIRSDGVINAESETDVRGVGEIKVLNQTGSELPSTGGTGTTIFYIIGSILVVGAGVLLITRRRMSAGDKK